MERFRLSAIVMLAVLVLSISLSFDTPSYAGPVVKSAVVGTQVVSDHPAQESSALELLVLSFAILLGTVAAAENVPVRRAKAKSDKGTDSIQIQQRDPIVMPGLGQELGDDIRENIVKPLEKGKPSKSREAYLNDLAFMEEPVTIVIAASTERDAPKHTDIVSTNGIRAEILMGNKWVQIGHLPRAVPITVKRKTANELLRSKQDTVRTVIPNPQAPEPENRVEFSTNATAPFQMIKDANPKGAEWLLKVATGQI